MVESVGNEQVTAYSSDNTRDTFNNTQPTWTVWVLGQVAARFPTSAQFALSLNV